MADEATSKRQAPQTPPAEGQAKNGKQAQPPTSKAAAQEPPASDKDTQQEVVSVTDFRRMQSTLTKKAQDADRQAQMLQQQLQQMKQQLNALQVKDMEPEQAQQFQANQYIQDLQMQLRQKDEAERALRIEMQANDELMRVSRQSDIPFATLKEMWIEGKTPADIWEYATEETKRRLTRKQLAEGEKAVKRMEALDAEVNEDDDADAPQRQPDEREVDLGSGRAPREVNELEEAKKNRDGYAFTRAYLRAKAS